MERQQELKKLIHVLHRTARTAARVQWMNAGASETRFAITQYNKILARLGELDPPSHAIFAPLPDDSSLLTVAMACRQVVSYYEDEVQLEEEGWPRAFGFGVKTHCGDAKDFTIEDVGNFVRDRLQEVFQDLGKRNRPADTKPTE